MPNTRADYNPPLFKNIFNVIYAADIPTEFNISPTTGDLTKVVNQQALEQSMINIINTYAWERPYSSLGTYTQLGLFENANSIEQELIKQSIMMSLTTYEPRVTVVGLDISVSPDEDAYQLAIEWTSQYVNPPKVLNVILSRTR